MKTIEQLLELAKNPYYKFTPEDQRVLDAFLEKRQGSHLKKSPENSSKESPESIRVTVRNVVDKVDTYLPDVQS